MTLQLPPKVEREKDLPSEDGVRIVIQLVALDDFGKELSSVNRQSTYLHVVRLGSPVVGEDHRSWVVKVVKREATASISHFIDARIRLYGHYTDWPAYIPSA